MQLVVLVVCFGWFASGVSSPAPGGPLPCKVQFQPLLNTPEAANHGLETSRQVSRSMLELNSAGPPGQCLDSPGLPDTVKDDENQSIYWIKFSAWI